MSRRTSTRQPEPRASPTKDTRYTHRRSSESAEAAHRSSSRPQPFPLKTAYTSPPDLSRGAQSASTSRRAQTFDDDDTNELPFHRFQPVFKRVRRSEISAGTLRFYDLPYYTDPDNSDYYIIKQELTQREIDVLYERTWRQREIDVLYGRSRRDNDPYS